MMYIKKGLTLIPVPASPAKHPYKAGDKDKAGKVLAQLATNLAGRGKHNAQP